MNQLQVFNFEELPVRTITIENEPFFVGKDVADILGYKNGSRDINAHVDEEDKLKYQISTSGQMREQTIINESGLYSLIFGSRLESAKRFKRWVTSEVLPAIRKTGSYEVPSNPMEALKLMFDAQTETKRDVDQVKAKVINLEENQKLDVGEYNFIRRAISERVSYIKRMHSLSNTREVNKQLYKDINSEVKKMTGISTRSQLKQKHFTDVLDMINNWFPSHSTLYLIKQMNIEEV